MDMGERVLFMFHDGQQPRARITPNWLMSFGAMREPGVRVYA